MFVIRSRELEFWEDDTWVEYGESMYAETSWEAMLLVRKHDWGGKSWDIAEVCPMTGLQGPWEYYAAEFSV